MIQFIAFNRVVTGIGVAPAQQKGKQMRLNRKKFEEIMEQEGLTLEVISVRTGISTTSLKWIMNNGSVSSNALERIADVSGVACKEICLPDISGCSESVIEFIKGSEIATVSFPHGKFKSRIKKLAEAHPDECQIIAENEDGSLCAHIPVKWIRINPTKRMTDEQRRELASRLNGSNF